MGSGTGSCLVAGSALVSPAGRLWHRDTALQHEVGLYYHLAWPDTLASDDLDGGVEPGHLFCWTPAGELGSVRFEPAGLIPVLQNLGDGLHHVVLDRRRAGKGDSAERA